MSKGVRVLQQPWIVMGYHEWLKRELALRLRRAMTPSEIILWQHVRARRLGGLKFRRQQIVFGFIADFHCHEAGLVVEVDGDAHIATGAYDAERDRILREHGMAVLHFTNAEVDTNVYAVTRKILATAKQHQTTPLHKSE